MIVSETSSMRTYENHLPRRVITGRGASEDPFSLCQAHGWRRVFVVSDAGVEAAALFIPGARLAEIIVTKGISLAKG